MRTTACEQVMSQCWQQKGNCDLYFRSSIWDRVATLHGSEHWEAFKCRGHTAIHAWQRMRGWSSVTTSLNVTTFVDIHIQALCQYRTPDWLGVRFWHWAWIWTSTSTALSSQSFAAAAASPYHDLFLLHTNANAENKSNTLMVTSFKNWVVYDRYSFAELCSQWSFFQN